VTGGLSVTCTSPGDVPRLVYAWFSRSLPAACVDGRFVAGSFVQKRTLNPVGTGVSASRLKYSPSRSIASTDQIRPAVMTKSSAASESAPSRLGSKSCDVMS
jgi:hypothetical protein